MHDTFYRLPTQSGRDKSYYLVNPDQVVALRPDQMGIGEYPSTRPVQGTTILFVNGASAFSPLSPEEVADLLEINVAGQEAAEEANA